MRDNDTDKKKVKLNGGHNLAPPRSIVIHHKWKIYDHMDHMREMIFKYIPGDSK